MLNFFQRLIQFCAIIVISTILCAGLFAFLMASGELNHNFAPLFYLPALGLIGQLIWMRKGINEETYQLPE